MAELRESARRRGYEDGRRRTPVSAGTLSAGHARALLPLADDALIAQFAKEIVEKGLSVRQTEQWVKDFLKVRKPKAPKERSKYLTEVELSLCEVLGRKVSVRGSEKGGTITIEFFDKNDLKKLSEMFED